jgi:hypothetical protein
MGCSARRAATRAARNTALFALPTYSPEEAADHDFQKGISRSSELTPANEKTSFDTCGNFSQQQSNDDLSDKSSLSHHESFSIDKNMGHATSPSRTDNSSSHTRFSAR